MDFQSAVRQALSRYATFTGRATRSEYWWFVLFVALVNVVAGIVDIILLDTGVIDGLLALALLLPGLAVSVRRLHDIGRSGWWLLLCLVPLVGWIVLIYFHVQPSQPGANEFGPRPAA